jgi:hypothetical protein
MPPIDVHKRTVAPPRLLGAASSPLPPCLRINRQLISDALKMRLEHSTLGWVPDVHVVLELFASAEMNYFATRGDRHWMRAQRPTTRD